MTVAPREPALEVAVSFDGSGEFDEAIDNLTDRLLKGTLRISSGRDEALPGGRPKVTDFGWTSHNYDGQLSNFLASSARYRLMRPGKPARINMTAGSAAYDDAYGWDGVWYWEGRATVTAATGIIKAPRQSSSVDEQEVEFSASGRMARLLGTRISTPLYQSIRVDQAINYLLDAVGWPSDARDLAIADTTLLFWWLDDEEPLQALINLLDTEGIPAAIFERGNGTLVFQNRNWRTTAVRSTDSLGIFFDRSIAGTVDYDANVDYDDAWPWGDVGESLYHDGVEDDPLYDEIYNAASMTVRRRSVGALQKVWEYGETLTLSAGETRDVPFTTSDPSTGYVAPTSGTDYTVSAGALASTPTLVVTNAQRGVIRFVAGGSGATILGVTSNGPQLRATPATVVREIPVTHSIDTTDALAENDGIVRTFEVGARQEIAEATGVAICDAAVAHQQHQRSRIHLTFENVNFTHLAYQLMLEVSDRITVKSGQLGYGIAEEEGDFWVEQKELRREPGKLVCVLTCQQILPEAGGALWDDGLWDDGLWAR